LWVLLLKVVGFERLLESDAGKLGFFIIVRFCLNLICKAGGDAELFGVFSEKKTNKSICPTSVLILLS